MWFEPDYETVVVKLSQVIEYVVKIARVDNADLLAAIRGGVLGNTPLVLEIVGIVLTAAMVFVMYFTLQHSIKLSREQEYIRQKDRLLEEMQTIMKAVSSLFPKITELIQPAEIQNSLFDIYRITKWSYFLSSRLPITLGYIEEYAVVLKKKAGTGHNMVLSESDKKELFKFHDEVSRIFQELALFPRTLFRVRHAAEKLSAVSYNTYVAKKGSYKLLKRAMKSLRKVPPEPYDFSQDVVASPSQPKN